jgi:hypothetical protein
MVLEQGTPLKVLNRPGADSRSRHIGLVEVRHQSWATVWRKFPHYFLKESRHSDSAKILTGMHMP